MTQVVKEIKSFENSIQDIDEKSLKVKAYSGVFGNRDLGDDILMKGSTELTIKRHGPNGDNKIKTLAFHKPERLIGMPIEMYEDGYGVYTVDEFANIPDAKNILELIKFGAITDKSIGYNIKRQKQVGGARQLLEIGLLETSFVTWGMNPEANVIGFKSLYQPKVHDYIKNLYKAMREGDWHTDGIQTLLEYELKEVTGYLETHKCKDCGAYAQLTDAKQCGDCGSGCGSCSDSGCSGNCTDTVKISLNTENEACYKDPEEDNPEEHCPIDFGTKFSYVSLEIGGMLRECILTDFKNVIKSEDLYDGADSFESNPHITIKTGLHTQDSQIVEEAIKSMPPFTVNVKGVDFFKQGDKEVLYLVVDSPHLKALHDALCKLPNTKLRDTFKPHITIARLGLGCSEHYKHALKSFETNNVTFDTLAFRDSNEVRTEIKLMSAVELEPTQEPNMDEARLVLTEYLENLKGDNPSYEVFQEQYEAKAGRKISKANATRLQSIFNLFSEFIEDVSSGSDTSNSEKSDSGQDGVKDSGLASIDLKAEIKESFKADVQSLLDASQGDIEQMNFKQSLVEHLASK